ncbi:nuclear transport factor 2 family protein [Rufibacter roseus]|uniref:Nuclear transport factor 2 family protein n=1 Tax=Rufibacter roseus TaxID=1567108 RepID=A0ABW2DKZ8_9BACT|nr:nuclear transport factor 2 family protein [Rufibacter roseus]
MRKILTLLSLCLFLQLAVVAQTKEENQVAAAVEQLKQALISGDRQALESIVAEGLSYGHSSGKVEDKATFVETLVTGKSDFVTIDLENQIVQVSGNTALVRHNLTATTNDSGKPGSVKLGVLLVWQKQNGKWKLLARQAYKI